VWEGPGGAHAGEEGAGSGAPRRVQVDSERRAQRLAPFVRLQVTEPMHPTDLEPTEEE
jgi:hypothetical protein